MFVSSGVFEWAGRMLFYFGLTLRDLGLSDQAAVLLTAVILPLLTAAAVFICLRRASLARKFSVYFISMLIYVLLTVFIFSDIKGFAASLGADTSGISDGFLDLTGLHAATSVGIVFFGFNTIFCSSGITKPRGRLALLVLTLFFFILDLVFFITLLKPDLNGYESVVAFSFTGKSRTGSFEIGFGIISFLTLFLYIACGFLCFTANKTAAEISEDNRRMFSALSYQKSTVNGVEKNSSSYLTEVFSAVVFSPEHLSLIKRGPNIRRKFLDAAICQHRIRYASMLAKYNQIINQRNALLKDIYKHPELKDTLSIWDDSLIEAGARILKERFDYLRQMKEPAREYHRGISSDKEELSIEYLCTAKATEDDSLDDIRGKLRREFSASRHEDYRTGYTSVGPHRDDLDFKINGISARRFGSQGQQRSAVLSLKLSEADLLYRKNGERPVILLDDVLSELDNKRQDFLLNKVEDYQVFVTCCEESNKEQLKRGKVFYIENGVISE